MKNLSFLILLALLYPAVHQAQTYEYDYDAAGNRISRRVVTLSIIKSKQAAADTLQENETQTEMAHDRNQPETIYNETQSNFRVKIYPNPTQGRMKISISGPEEIKNISFELTTLNGRTILKRSEMNNEFDIDIISEPTGVFLMQLQINNSLSHWKIIKQ